MIISRTPFRISFFGGGTDYPVWYEKHGGAVLATSIDKYCYVTCRYLPPFFDYNYRIRYTEQEYVKTTEAINHPSVRECLQFLKVERGLEVQHNADLPARIGLGSSSSFTVGLLNALHALTGQMVSKQQLALEAIQVEQDRIRENVGSQDQTIAAFGGFNRIDFDGIRKIQVTPVTVGEERLKVLHAHLMLFFTGFTRTASEIAADQVENTPKKTKELGRLHEMVKEATGVLGSKDGGLDQFGKLLHEGWMIKRTLTTRITTPYIDDAYEAAMNAGAIGGKLLGAGGGGCILLFVPPERQARVREELKRLLYIPFRFENLGSQIIYYAPQSDF